MKLLAYLKTGIALVIVCVISIFVTAQTLPNDWQISPDGHRLVIGNKAAPVNGLYDSTLIRSVYLDFTQANYWTLLTNNYTTHTDLPASMTVDNVVYDSVGVRFKGMTSYQGVSGQKKSFNVSLDYVHSNQDIMGYKTLNLNNSYQDESFIREVFYLNQIKKHIPAAKSNYVHLFINNQDWGLYPNIQQLNKDFLKEWFLSNDGANWRADRPPGSPGGPGGGWGDSTSALNYRGTDTTSYKTYYTLKSSDAVADPWSLLVTLCDKLNRTPVANLPQVLPQYLDIDRTLWYLASEVAFSDDDGYIYKGKMDYYVYYEPETGRFTPQEYDGNSVMDPTHVTWSAFYNATNDNYPLLYFLLQVPQWRQRYLAHLRTIIADEMDPTTCNALIDNFKLHIDSMVLNDPKKLYTYTQFNSEITVLKNFISNRRTNLLANAEVAQVAPVIASVDYYDQSGNAWIPPADNDSVNVTSSVTSASGIDHVSLYYTTGLVGNFTETLMFDDGAHNDGTSGDGIFGATIPGFAGGTWVRFYVEAVSANASKSSSYMPAGAEHDVYVYIVAPLSSSNSEIVINELMASNTTTMADNFGEYDDWIELYNNSVSSMDMSGWYFTDNPANLSKWRMPQGTIIPSGGYLMFWADEDSSQGANHCNFKLSASGENLWLLDSNLVMMDSVSFGIQTTDMGYARVPNGTGPFVIQSPTFNAYNSPVGVSNITSVSSVAVFPNPSREKLNILISNPQNEKVFITNMLGEKIFECSQSNAIVINTGEWADGMYLVRINDYAGKLMIMH